MKKTGRPASATTLAARFTAKQVLETIDQAAMWESFLKSDDERIKLDAWKYLNDRVHGKPAQSVDMTTKGDAITFPPVIVEFVNPK